MTNRRDSCMSSEALIDAASGAGDMETRARVADHLITCAECADEFRLLQELAPWAHEHAHLVAPAGASRREPAPPMPAAPRWVMAAAALLAIATAGLAFEVLRLERTNGDLRAHINAAPPVDPAIAELTARVAEQQQRIDNLTIRVQAADAPDLNVPIIDLEVSDRPRSTAAPPAPIIPGSARHVVFVLSTLRPAAGATYEIDVLETADRIVWSGTGLQQSADGTLTLVVPRSFAKSGTRIRLYARHGTARTLVEQYVVPNLR